VTVIATQTGHVEPMPVHFDDLDAMGIVHNARYAVMLERALSAFWSRHGFGFDGGDGGGAGGATKSDVFHAVAEYAISYRAPIRRTGEVGVHFWVERLGESSVVYGFRVVSADGETVHAQGRRVNVKLDPVTLRPAPWSDEARAIIADLTAPSADLTAP
jgi:acyl-CoA thioester hydrolase